KESLLVNSLQEVLMMNWNCLVNCQVEWVCQANLVIVVPQAIVRVVMLTARRSVPVLPLALLPYLSHRWQWHVDDLAYGLQCEPRLNATRCWDAGVIRASPLMCSVDAVPPGSGDPASLFSTY